MKKSIRKVWQKYWELLFVSAACFLMWFVHPLVVLGISVLVVLVGTAVYVSVGSWYSPWSIEKRNREKCEREGHDLSLSIINMLPEGAQTSCDRCRALVDVAPSGCLMVSDDRHVGCVHDWEVHATMGPDWKVYGCRSCRETKKVDWPDGTLLVCEDEHEG